MSFVTKKILPLLLVAGWAVILSSCITAKTVNYFQEPNKDIPSYADTLSFEDYKIRPQDRLYIKIYTTDETANMVFNGGNQNYNSSYILNGNTQGGYELYTYRVDDSGNIRFPMVGMVPMAGLTLREAREALTAKLDGKVSHPYVEVYVTQRSFSVIGATGEGRFSITKEKLTIYEALAMAGDIGDFGDRGHVRVIRTLPDGRTAVKTFDVRSKDIINSEFYYIEPNDVIYVSMLNEQVFGLNSIGAVISTVASTISFGVFIYSLVNRFVK